MEKKKKKLNLKRKIYELKKLLTNFKSKFTPIEHQYN